jgi:high-affinity iron transporter
MHERRRVLRSALLVAVLGAGSTSIAALQPTPSPRVPATETAEAERLVFLLQYVGNDYGGAVRDGRVIDEAEYQENREFAALIVERFPSLRPVLGVARAARLETAVRSLQSLIASRAEAQRVKQVAESAIAPLIEAFELRSYPRHRPNPERARGLYEENCKPCHGPRGDGDGPRARELDPPPARFSERTRLDNTAPYAFYNAITLGVENTAMASFADSLSDQERWDLTFYLWTFALPRDEQNRSAPPLTLSLRDLATRSSAELATEAIRQAASRGEKLDSSEAMLWVARLRANPPVLSDSQERLARLRQDLARSIELVAENDLDAAVDRVTTSYLTEFEPLEPEIDRRDVRVRRSFERDLIEFRSALRRDDREGASRIAGRLERTVDRAAALLAGPPSASHWRWVAAALVAALAALGAVFVTRRIGKRPLVG